MTNLELRYFMETTREKSPMGQNYHVRDVRSLDVPELFVHSTKTIAELLIDKLRDDGQESPLHFMKV